MSKKMNRRSFVKKSAVIGASSQVGGNILSNLIDGSKNIVYGKRDVFEGE